MSIVGNNIKNLQDLKEHLESILWEPIADIVDSNDIEAIGEAKAIDYIIDVIEAAKYVLDSGLPQTSAPLHRVFSLEVAKILEERGYRFSDILKILSSLPEDFFKEIIEENPYSLKI